MKHKRFRMVTNLAFVSGLAVLFFFSRSDGDHVDASVAALRRAGVIVSPLTPVPLTGTFSRSRIYVMTQIPFGLCRYSISIPSGQCTDENLKLIASLAEYGVLTNIAFCNDSVSGLRSSSIEELFELSNCSAEVKQELSRSLGEVQIGVFPTTPRPATESM